MMSRSWLIMLATCTHAASPAEAPHKRSGPSMLEVGIRFERAGKAALALRWDLASYDLVEIGEVFEADFATAKWLANADAPRLLRKFTDETVPALQQAAKRRDPDAFKLAVAAAARACNECHRATGKTFLEISETLGAPVPTVGP